MAKRLPDRPCGECSVCCTYKPIDAPGFAKAPGLACQHCLPSGGCGIYDTRFEICRTYRCGWKYLSWLPEAIRPDRSGVLIDIVESQTPGHELEATLLAFRDGADLERNPIPDIIASLIEQGVLVHLSRPGPPGMLNAKAAMNERLGPAIRQRDAERLFAELRAAVRALEKHDWAPFRSRSAEPEG
jgi:hypothetical protein